MPPPRVPGLMRNYRRDRPVWTDQPMQNKSYRASQNIACYKCYAHKHYSSDCRLHYARWKEGVANFESLTSAKQKQVTRLWMEIAVTASQVSKD